MSQVMKTPQSNFSGPIVVDPLTRIEGHLRIEVEVENGRIKDARSCGTLYRGLEVILKGRDPRDAQHFTQRTCGVCTYTHALAPISAIWCWACCSCTTTWCTSTTCTPWTSWM